MHDNKYTRVQAIAMDTGEIMGNVLLNESEQLVMKAVNAKQSKSFKVNNKNKNVIKCHIRANEGSFVHMIYKYRQPILDKLQTKCEGNKVNIHIIRFIQLATYSTFGGKLFDNNKNRIKKSSLKTIWDTTSRNSINETYELLKECGYIYETEEGYIMISEELIVKGEIEDFKRLKKSEKDLTYTRIFSKNVQDMYIGTEPKARKQLANLFKVLPYINFTHNVFCMNPTEVDHTQLKLCTWTDLARLCGYDDKKQIARFKKNLWTLKIYGFDTIGEFKTQSGMAICINPKVYYAGNNIDDVNRLYVMFEMCEGSNKSR